MLARILTCSEFLFRIKFKSIVVIQQIIRKLIRLSNNGIVDVNLEGFNIHKFQCLRIRFIEV
ncbi:hypothetical protein D3C85_1534400 [compost metagenome]